MPKWDSTCQYKGNIYVSSFKTNLSSKQKLSVIKNCKSKNTHQGCSIMNQHFNLLLFLYSYPSPQNSQFDVQFIVLHFFFFFQYQASECGKSFGCFRKPENCAGEDCEYLITFKAAGNMSDYIDIAMTTKWQWIGLGHNMEPMMVNYTTFKPRPKKLVLNNSHHNQYRFSCWNLKGKYLLHQIMNVFCFSISIGWYDWCHMLQI